MFSKRACSLAVLCNFVLLIAVHGAESLEELAELYLKNAITGRPVLDPTGTRIAFQTYRDGRYALVAKTLEGGDWEVFACAAGYRPRGIAWVNEVDLIYDLVKWDYFTLGLHVTRTTEGMTRPLQSAGSRLHFQLIDPLPQVADTVLVQAHPDDAKYPDAYYMSLPKFVPKGNPLHDYSADGGNKRLAVKNFAEIERWIADDQGFVFLAYASKDNEPTIYYRPDKSHSWQKTFFPSLFFPLHFLPATHSMLIASRHESPYRGVGLLDVESGELTRAFLRHPPFDMFITSILKDPHTNELMGLTYHTDYPHILWTNDVVRKVVIFVRDALRASPLLPDDLFVEPLGFSPDAKTLYFTASSDRQPLLVMKFNFETRRSATLVNSRDWIDWKEMAPTEAVTFPARDGSMLHGYLTRPIGSDEKTPLIVDVIGGPGARTIWEFDPVTQFYVRQGYAVLNVNYRGCTGYGEDYEGDLEHALRHAPSDVADGARWAIKQGYADPGKIAITGVSFGGWVAAVSAAENPDLYCSVALVAGVYDWIEMYHDDAVLDRAWLDDFYIDFEDSEAFYHERSAVARASSIKAPVFIWHGKDDPRVSKAQSRAMAEALEDAGMEPETHFVGWGVHGWPDESDRIRYYTLLGEFLKKHLGEATKNAE